MCGGKIFKPNWVGLSVGKVRSVCVKLQRNCLPFFGRLMVVGSVVLRLLVTFCSLPKVAIFSTNFHRSTKVYIPTKLSYEALNRHFWQGAVTCWRSCQSLLCQCFKGLFFIIPPFVSFMLLITTKALGSIFSISVFNLFNSSLVTTV